MDKVSCESSYKLSELSSAIGEINRDMEQNLKLLNNAFMSACVSWKDKNAQACRNALSGHNEAMRSALNNLGHCETAVDRLSRLAAEYENI